MNKTSEGICRRDCVTAKTFSGEITGRVRTRRKAATAIKRRIQRNTALGTGCTLRPWILGAFLALRYHPIIFGIRTGPKKIRRDLILWAGLRLTVSIGIVWLGFLVRLGGGRVVMVTYVPQLIAAILQLLFFCGVSLVKVVSSSWFCLICSRCEFRGKAGHESVVWPLMSTPP